MDVAVSEREVQRSFALGVFNGALFNFAARLIDPPLVLTWFVSQLTPSNLLVGMVAPLGQACWFLPQVFVSTRIQRMERKMPGYSLAAAIRVVVWFLLAAAVWFIDTPTILLLSFFALYSTAWAAGGLAGLSFFDVVAKTIPARRRGSLFAWRQFLGGLLGLGAGWVVNVILRQPAFPFPRGHAFLFLLYGITIIPAMGAFAAIREPPGQEVLAPLSHSGQLRRAREVLRTDAVYRRYIAARLVLGLAEVALPFYGIYAKRVLEAPESMVGIYVATRVAAQLMFNLPWGWLSDRHGNQIVMRLMSIGSGLAAAGGVALVVAVESGRLHGGRLPYLAVPLFFLNGAVLPGKILSGSNFLLELVSEGQRPLYLGLSNTLMGVVVLISGLGGLIVDLLGFVGLFTAVAGLCAAAYVLASTLPTSRQRQECNPAT
ncbi:MAG: MFS transporter [Anaerolineae bacterium]